MCLLSVIWWGIVNPRSLRTWLTKCIYSTWLDSQQSVSFVNDLTNYKGGGAHLQLHKESDSPFEGKICVCQIMNRSLALVADVKLSGFLHQRNTAESFVLWHARMHACIYTGTQTSLRCNSVSQCPHTSFNHVSPSTHSHTHTHTVSFRFSQGRQCFQLLSTTGNVTHKYGLTKLSWNVTKQQQGLNDWSHYIKGAKALFSDFCVVHNWLPPDTLIPFIQTESNQNIF